MYVGLDKSVPETDDADILVQNWLLVELITYYAQIILGMLFMAYSSLVRPLKPTRAMRKILTKKR